MLKCFRSKFCPFQLFWIISDEKCIFLQNTTCTSAQFNTIFLSKVTRFYCEAKSHDHNQTAKKQQENKKAKERLLFALSTDNVV